MEKHEHQKQGAGVAEERVERADQAAEAEEAGEIGQQDGQDGEGGLPRPERRELYAALVHECDCV